MPIDLTTPGITDDQVDLVKTYYHATLLRLFVDVNDGRADFWAQVPGIKQFWINPQIVGDTLLNTDIFLDHFLLRFDQGYVNLLGGTKLLGWPHHVASALTPPTPLSNWFANYWYDLATVANSVISTKIPSSNTQPILYLGHSLGGASSVAACYQDFDRPGPRPRAVVSFGCPKTRTKSGMDGRDFTHLRVAHDYDLVPYLPVNPLRVPLILAPFKIAFVSWQQYGTPLQFQHGDMFTFGFEQSLNVLLAPFAVLGATGYYGGPFATHYMVHYAYCLRVQIEKLGLSIDPWWDGMNAWLNQVDNVYWAIPGFPAAPAPTSPAAPSSPNPDDISAYTETARAMVTVESADLLAWQPKVAVEPNQALAPALSAASGRDFRDVLIRLSKQAIPDVTNVTLASFVDADFDGYHPADGPFWVRTAVSPTFGQRRYAGRAAFSCNSNAVPNQIFAWWAEALEGDSLTPALVGFGQFAVPFAMDKPRLVRVLELEFAAGPV